jgi:universal stress protein A
MKLLERILVAVDGRQSAQSVIDEATSVAEKFQSEVVLLHVLPSEKTQDEEMKQYVNAAREGIGARLSEYKAQMEKKGVTVGEEIIAEGTPFDQIIRHAADLDVNVVILGASRHSEEQGEGNLGFTAERVCRKSPKPVWVVHSDGRNEKKAVLCPIDFSSPSRRALWNAVHLARRFGAKLTILHVVQPWSTVFGIDLPGGESKVKERHLETEKKRFQDFLGEFDFHEVDTDEVTLVGEPGKKIQEFSREMKADLIVMGSVGRTGLARILMGSVAGTVLHELPCSLIMMKAEEAIQLKMEEQLTDIREHYAHGLELMANGFPNEAIREFKHCVATNEMFLPAWEALVQAYERIGETQRADKTRKTVEELEEILSWRRIEAEIRSQHSFWKDK